VVLENVVGTITSHGGKDFATLVRTIADTGYAVGPVVINAVHFLPQSRPRLFVIAVSLDEKIPLHLTSQVYSRFFHPRSLLKAYFELPAHLERNWVWWNFPEPTIHNEFGLSAIIENEPTGVVWHSKEETDRLIAMMSKRNKEKLASAQRQKAKIIGTVYRRTRPVSASTGTRRLQRAEIRFDGVSGCLRTPVGGSSRQTIVIVEGKDIRSRLLSPREAARLMGVPEDYPLPEKYNDAYHLFGDGVAVPVVSWIENHLLRPLVQVNPFEQVA
jgi:DNA (cytosine-5)-methyltransferase 1